MKNKLNLLRLTKRLSRIGLSFVLIGGILCNNSYAGSVIFDLGGGGCDHRGRYWWISSSAPYYAENTACCKDKRTYYYDYSNPNLNFSLENPNNVDTPNGIIAFEKGTTIPNTLIEFAPDNGEDGPPFSDSFSSVLELDGSEVSLSPSTGSLDISSYNIGKHTLYAEVDDTYYEDDSCISETKEFYIGPYPTIYYNAYVEDGNINSDGASDNYSYHKDTIKIENIKLLSTYQPNSLTFYIYANGTFHNKTISSVSSSKFYYDTDGNAVGYITEFDNFTVTAGSSILGNILPLTKPYIMVKVNDGRTGSISPSNSNRPKNAKYSQSVATL